MANPTARSGEQVSGDRPAPVLQVENLRVYYDTTRGPVKAVDGVTFDLQPGERMGLIGESGSGKTTLATAIMRLIHPPGRIAGGHVLLGGRDLLAMNDAELRQVRLKDIALIPQAAMNSLNPVMRIRNLIVDAIVAHEKDVSRQNLRLRVEEVLDQVGLPAVVADRYPHQLSGGMKQRAAMAIAISLKPRVIVADEPTSALDVVVQRQVMVTLGRVQEGLNAAVILIGHDMGLVAQFADVIGVLYAGKMVENGSADNILDAPKHPYTRLLIDSLPKLDMKRELRGIPGLPPTLLNLPDNCPFHSRCPFAFERCREEAPSLQEVTRDWWVACHLYPGRSELPVMPNRPVDSILAPDPAASRAASEASS
jgi:peptide/nickel transport system ATP-binding protein